MQNSFEENLIKKYVPKDLWQSALEKLSKGYPVQYIVGNVEFMGNIINVNEDVLIPRFETEYLVNDVLKLIKDYDLKNPKILDIGTGSGCIAISIKKSILCDMSALDISQKAINVAKENASLLKTDINFICEDMENYTCEEKYDVIISNPPYVSYDGKVDEKIKYEPQNAIFAKEDGLYFYKIIFKKALKLVNKKFIIALEIGDGQGEILQNMAQTYFPLAKVYYKKDLNNFDRYLYIINE